MNSNKRLQSALEMLTTYGFMIALAAIVLITIFYFATPTSQIEPSTCNAYGSIDCYNIQYYSNTITNTANVFIYLSNSGSSPANVIGVNVIISGVSGPPIYGTCTNDTAYPAGNTIVFPGGNTLCSAAIPNGAVHVGKEVVGQFVVFVQSCNSGVSKFSAQCGFLTEHYTGTFIIYANQQPATTVSASPPPTSMSTTTVPAYYVPITISNSGTSPTPTPYQAMVTIPSFSYDGANEINSGWQNVEFTYNSPAYSGGTPIYAWVESGASNTATSTVVWLKLTKAIPASSSVTVYMNFMPSNIMSSTTSYTGEAPQLSPTYGQYDNGALVFLSYFNGDTSLSNFNAPSGITISQSTGVPYPGSASGTVSAINIAGYGSVSWYGMSFATAMPNEAIIAETNAQNLNNPSDMGYVSIVNNPTATSITNAQSVDMGFGSTYFTNDYLSGGTHSVNLNPQGTANTNWNYGSTTYFGSDASSYTGYISPQLYSGGYSGTPSVNPLSSSTNLYLGLIGDTLSSYPWNENINWMRARAYAQTTSTVGALTPTNTMVLYYVPITLTNSQASATPAPFQQLITVPSSTYSQYINSQWSNVEFTTGKSATGTILQAWVESNPSNTASATNVWVNLPNGLPAQGSLTIYMDMMAANVMSASGPTGEAPQLSSTYAQYDNGASVFTNYWNFAGTTLPSTFNNQLAGTGGSYTVSNGITLTITTGGAGYYEHVYSTSTYNPVGQIVEALQTTSGGGADQNIQWAVSLGTSGSDGWGNINTVGFGYNGGKLKIRTISNGVPTGYVGTAITTPGIVSGSWQATGSNEAFWNYITTQQGGTSTQPTIGSAYIDLFIDDIAGSTTFQYVRTRAYPPNGVMPSVSFGTGSNTYTPPPPLNPPLGQAYVPITITNPTQNQLPSGFQELITVPTSTYAAYINSQWSNIEFTIGSPAYQGGVPVQAWIESGAYNASTTTNVWLSIPVSISGTYGSNTLTLYMNFMSSSVMSASGPTGEAPQLSSTYAEYDNGASVFSNYYNFAGTTLDSRISTISGVTLTQNNGLSVAATTTGTPFYILTTSQTSSPVILEADETYYGVSTDTNSNEQWGLVLDSSTSTSQNTGGVGTNYWARILNLANEAPGIIEGSTTIADGNLNYVSQYTSIDSFIQTPSGLSATFDGTTETVSTTALTSGYLGFYIYSSTAASTIANLQWLLTRDYPPSGIMPSVSFGSVA